MDGKRLKEKLKESGITQQMLSEKIGVSRSLISLWIGGYSKPNKEHLKQVAEILGCTVDYLNGIEVGNMEAKTDILRNGSGYVDETAFKAIKHIESKDMDYCRGEIWEYNLQNNETKYAIVISVDECVNGKYRSIILLTDEQKGVINVPIVCRGRMYADCGMVSFGMVSRFGNYIKNATEAEMKELEAGIAKALGITVSEESESPLAERWQERCEKVQRDLYNAEQEAKEAKLTIEAKNKEIASLEEKLNYIGNQPVFERDPEEVVILKAQVAMLEKQNEMLLDRLIG